MHLINCYIGAVLVDMRNNSSSSLTGVDLTLVAHHTSSMVVSLFDVHFKWASWGSLISLIYFLKIYLLKSGWIYQFLPARYGCASG